jgi:hypothetical protein
MPTVAAIPVAMAIHVAISIAPPMSDHFPSAFLKVIGCYCFRNSHNIAYRQSPHCYKTGGGMNYTDW